jgi:hypothetical protein
LARDAPLGVHCDSAAPLLAYSISEVPPENWAMRKTTNSAGFTGATPMSTISCPASMV